MNLASMMNIISPIYSRKRQVYIPPFTERAAEDGEKNFYLRLRGLRPKCFLNILEK